MNKCSHYAKQNTMRRKKIRRQKHAIATQCFPRFTNRRRKRYVDFFGKHQASLRV